MQSLQFKVGQWVLDERTFCIRNNDKHVELSPTAFKLLQLFISHEDKVVSIATIKEQVWQTEFTTDNLVYQTIRNLRLALEDGNEQDYIKTVPRFGYQLIAPVTQHDSKQVSRSVAPRTEREKNRFVLIGGILVALLAVMVLTRYTWLYFNQTQSHIALKVNTPTHLVVINPFSGQNNEVFSQFVDNLSKTLHITQVQRAEHSNMLETINGLGSDTKIVLEYISDKNAMLGLVFMGLPSRLVHVEMQPLEKLDQAVVSNLVSRITTPMLKQGNSGIAELVRANTQLKALASLSYSEQLEMAKQKLFDDIEVNSLNEQQKRAKLAFIDTLLAFYQIDHFDNDRLLSGVNYLLARYHQSNYSIISAALYLAEQGAINIAFQLVEKLEQDHFITYIQGLLHLELGEDERALHHFEKVFKHEQSFEDNAYFYFQELLYSKQNTLMRQYRGWLDSKSYLSNNIDYIFFNWYVMHGKFELAMSLLTRFQDQLTCNDDLTGSAAMLNSALGDVSWSERWMTQLNEVNARDWRIPWLTFANYATADTLATYSNWYQGYASSVLGNNSLFEPLFLSAVIELSIGQKQHAEQAQSLMTRATSSFSQDAVIKLANAVIESQLAFDSQDERIQYLLKYEPLALALPNDEIALSDLILGSYFMLSDDINKAERALVQGCKKSPALCERWGTLPIFSAVVNTTSTQLTINNAKHVISAAQPALEDFNQQLFQVCR
ncbi:winged helix-turn-helix domain-containing protein [Pseudoalteromonas sp. MMG012]|uniref:winged helix-turn-helix domain-containing protein n=1 Tax=Pseudoalteromonas sp. MMG012 TaxID=2822686 RepID=UPI001B3A2091|nr:winged helix-turn-helix domain-containing protein [Pseudoalteromonas sp. MMG012]MBQ4852216.1 winged helix-turn-helix domain-containing protein [Pseudoalteromonas sp. MMG012]